MAKHTIHMANQKKNSNVTKIRNIARELVATVRNNVTIDWTIRENVRAQLRRRNGRPEEGVYATRPSTCT